MTKKALVIKILLIALALSISLFAVSCTEAVTPTALATPDVSVDDDGVASWDYVPNAARYVYIINDGDEETTYKLKIQLNDGDRVVVKAVSDSDGFSDSAWSLPVSYKASEQTVKLDIPTVTVSQDTGVATWNSVSGASGYFYKLNNGTSVFTSELTVALSDGDTIVVKAVNEAHNAESDWSEPKNYTAYPETEKVKLDTPSVTISQNGIASWQKIEGATAYVYKINGGEPQQTTELSISLSDGDTVTVKALGGGDFSDSSYSIAVQFICTHADSDDNGACDNCQMKTTITIDIYAINDLHGAFMDTDDQPGVDELMTYLLSKYEDDSAYELLLSSGDMWQGTVESSSNRGKLMTEWMNLMGFASMTIGNHEFDWGIEYIISNAEIANFPFLAINLRYNGEKLDCVESSVIVELGGVKIGIIGALGDVKSSISGEFNQKIDFIVGNELTKLVQNEAKRLRNDEGCDIVIYSIHDNDESYDEELSNKNSGKGYVDAVFEAHTHSRYVRTDKYGVVHIQASGYNKAMSLVSFNYNILTESYYVTEKTTVGNAIYGHNTIEDHGAVRELYGSYFSENDPYTTVLGYNNSYLSSSDIENIVTALYLEYGREYFSEYDIVLAGASINVRSPGKLYAGDVTYSEIFQLLPFDNRIVLGKMKGKDITSKFINGTKLDYTLDYNGNFESNKYYYIITDTYCAYYSYNNIEIVDTIDEHIYARDLLAEMVVNGKINNRYLNKNARGVLYIAMPSFSRMRED